MVDILSWSLLTSGVLAVTRGQVFSRISDCRLKKHLAEHPLRSFKILWYWGIKQHKFTDTDKRFN